MATIATNLQNIRVNYPSLIDQFDHRKGEYALLQKGIQNANMGTGIISADLMQKARDSWGRIIDIPVMAAQGATAVGALGSGLTCTATGVEPVSALVNVTWVTVSTSFTMEPTKNDNNEISYAQEFMRKYSDRIALIAENIDVAVDTALTTALCPAAQYSSSYVGVGNKYGALVADRVQSSLTNRVDFFNDYTSIQKADEIRGRFDVIGSTNLESIVRQSAAQGQANDTNEAFQFNGYDFTWSNNVTVSAASDATMYILPKGSYGVIFRNSPDPMNNRRTTDGKQYGTSFDPTLGAMIDTMFYSECADINALSGNADDTAAVQEVHQIAVHYGILTPYSNFATSEVAGVIRAADLLTA
jgi:hypothetical protein